MSEFRAFLLEQLEDPKVKQEYDALEAEYAAKQAKLGRQEAVREPLAQPQALIQAKEAAAE